MDELTKTYLQIPSERLGVLLDNDFEVLYKFHKEIRDKWIREKNCSCISNLKKGEILRCSHLKKEIKKQTEKISKRIEIKTSILLVRNLLKFQRNQNRFDIF